MKRIFLPSTISQAAGLPRLSSLKRSPILALAPALLLAACGGGSERGPAAPSPDEQRALAKAAEMIEQGRPGEAPSEQASGEPPKAIDSGSGGSGQ